MFGFTTTHPLKKKILEKIQPRIEEAIVELEETQKKIDDDYYERINRLEEEHADRSAHEEDQILGRFNV